MFFQGTSFSAKDRKKLKETHKLLTGDDLLKVKEYPVACCGVFLDT